MSRLALALFCLCCAPAFAGGTAPSPHAAAHSAVLLAMGPDPGGHTGARVTPDTTKTGRAEVDAARSQASGAGVENKAAQNPDPQTQSPKPRN